MSMRWYHKLGSAVILMGITFVCLNMFPIKYNLNKSVSGVKWESNNAETYEKVAITIDGKYVKYILHFFHPSDYFEGSLSVSGYEFSGNDDFFLYRINFNPKHNNMGSVAYGSVNSEIMILGTIFQQEQMDKGVILLNNAIEDSEHQQMISFSCEDRTQAVAVAGEILPAGFQFD